MNSPFANWYTSWLLVFCLATMAHSFSGNPDADGNSWEGVTTLGTLKLDDWVSRLAGLGVDTPGLRFSIYNGAISTNLQLVMGNATLGTISQANTTVFELDNGDTLLTQMDYLSFSNHAGYEWVPLSELDSDEVIRSYLVLRGTETASEMDSGLTPLTADYMASIDRERRGLRGGSSSLNRRTGDYTIYYITPSATNTNGELTCYPFKDNCVNAQMGYKTLGGSAQVSGINWIVGWSHHFCKSSCKDNYYNYKQIYHKNYQYKIGMNGFNIYSGGMQTGSSVAYPSNSGNSLPQVSCGTWSGNIPACDEA